MWSTKPSAWSNATGAEQFERLWWQDVKDKKWNDVEARLAATYVSEAGGATRDRGQTIEHLKKLEISDFSLGEPESHPAGEAVVLTYVMTVHGSYDGSPLDAAPVRMMTVWQQQKSGWIAIALSEAAQP